MTPGAPRLHPATPTWGRGPAASGPWDLRTPSPSLSPPQRRLLPPSPTRARGGTEARARGTRVGPTPAQGKKRRFGVCRRTGINPPHGSTVPLCRPPETGCGEPGMPQGTPGIPRLLQPRSRRGSRMGVGRASEGTRAERGRRRGGRGLSPASLARAQTRFVSSGSALLHQLGLSPASSSQAQPRFISSRSAPLWQLEHPVGAGVTHCHAGTGSGGRGGRGGRKAPPPTWKPQPWRHWDIFWGSGSIPPLVGWVGWAGWVRC